MRRTMRAAVRELLGGRLMGLEKTGIDVLRKRDDACISELEACEFSNLIKSRGTRAVMTCDTTSVT